MQERGREEKERRKEKPVTTIGVTDLRPPLFVGMRVSFVPDTLTFSRKHSCLHSCSLGRDTHYSLLLPFVSCPSTRRSLLHPLSRLPSFHYWMPYKLLRMHACTHARTHACTHARGDVRAYPGRNAQIAAVRANTHACPSRAEEVDNPLALPLTHPLSSPFPHFCLPSASARRFSSSTLLGCARCMTFVCVSGIHYH